MLRFTAAFALTCASSQPIFAAQVNPSFFENDGQHYSYTTQFNHGAVRIEGKVLESGEHFSLIVSRSGWVTGKFGLTRVNFSVPRTTGDRLFVEVQGPEVAAATVAIK